MIFNDYHSYIASILNKKLIINRINDVKVLLANTSTLICCSYMHPWKFMFEQHFQFPNHLYMYFQTKHTNSCKLFKNVQFEKMGGWK